MPQKSSISTQKVGFTLIELIIVAGILSLTTAMGVASYNSFNEGQKVEQASREVLAVLRRVQSNAVSGKKDSCAATLVGWCVQQNSYYDKCSDDIPYPSPAPKLLDQTGIAVAAGSEFCFSPVYGDTNLNSSRTVTVTGGGLVENIEVTKEGLIHLQEGVSE